VLSMMHKCNMVKVGGNQKMKRLKIGGIYKIGRNRGKYASLAWGAGRHCQVSMFKLRPSIHKKAIVKFVFFCRIKLHKFLYHRFQWLHYCYN